MMGHDPDAAAPTPGEGLRRKQKVPLKERIRQLSTAGQFEAQVNAFKQNFPLWHTQHGPNISYSLGEPQVLLQPFEPCQFAASAGINKETGALEICMRPMPIQSEKHNGTQQQLKAAAFGLDARLMQDAENRQFVLNIHKTRAAPSLQTEWAQIEQTHAKEGCLAQTLALWEIFLSKVPPQPPPASVLQIPLIPGRPLWYKAFTANPNTLSHDDLSCLAIASVYDANYLAQRPRLKAPALAPRLSATDPVAQSPAFAQWLTKLHHEVQSCGATSGSYALYAGQANVLREGQLFSYGRLPDNLPGHASQTHYLVLETETVGATSTKERDIKITAPRRMEVYTFADATHNVAGKIASIQGIPPIDRGLACGPQTPKFLLNVNEHGVPTPSRLTYDLMRHMPARQETSHLLAKKEKPSQCMIL